ncbi:MAG: hypothetical protein LBQ54_08335 [Planctomycetaceae bacterium]|nr:hypothetical protein [Planctomycetaceae bacterium]
MRNNFIEQGNEYAAQSLRHFYNYIIFNVISTPKSSVARCTALAFGLRGLAPDGRWEACRFTADRKRLERLSN